MAARNCASRTTSGRSQPKTWIFVVYLRRASPKEPPMRPVPRIVTREMRWAVIGSRSEEHTSELQSQSNLVCRLLLEKKNNNMLASFRLCDEYSDRRSLALTVTRCPAHEPTHGTSIRLSILLFQHMARHVQ